MGEGGDPVGGRGDGVRRAVPERGGQGVGVGGEGTGRLDPPGRPEAGHPVPAERGDVPLGGRVGHPGQGGGPALGLPLGHQPEDFHPLSDPGGTGGGSGRGLGRPGRRR